MFDADYEEILDSMLENVPDDLDKREGSIIYDALAPVAMELTEAYNKLNMVVDEMFADTASYHYLIKRAAERGFLPYEATSAVLKGQFNIDINIGDRFTNGDLFFYASKKIENEDFCYEMVCETTGEEGNNTLGSLLAVEYIEGLESAELTDVLVLGEDAEEEEHFRERYFASLDTEAFGGNIADYKQKVKSITGVGGVKVYPAWNGGGTVKIVIIDSNFRKPTERFIADIQEKIDPVENTGEGLGIAPIGHKVTTAGVDTDAIDIQLNIEYQDGFSWEDIEGSVRETIDSYFSALSATWEESNSIVVRISQIESRVVNIEGVLDVSSTLLNGSDQNLILQENNIPMRGDVNG